MGKSSKNNDWTWCESGDPQISVVSSDSQKDRYTLGFIRVIKWGDKTPRILPAYPPSDSYSGMVER